MVCTCSMNWSFVGLEWETKSRCSSMMNRSARAWFDPRLRSGVSCSPGLNWGRVRLFVALEWETKSRCSSIMNRSARAWLKSEESLSPSMNCVRVVIAAV